MNDAAARRRISPRSMPLEATRDASDTLPIGGIEALPGANVTSPPLLVAMRSSGIGKAPHRRRQ